MIFNRASYLTGARKRVLIAEDDAANRQLFEALLGPSGVDLTFAVNGFEALRDAQVGGFDLILMDANMPIMNGTAALRAIRALSGPAARTPIHMLTANIFEQDARRYREAGADGVVTKPVDVQALYALLDSLDAVEEAPRLARAG